VTHPTSPSHGPTTVLLRRVVVSIVAAICASLIALSHAVHYIEGLHRRELAAHTHDVNDALFGEGIRTAFGAVALMQCVLGVLVIALLIQSILRPMRHFRAAVMALGAGDLDAPELEPSNRIDDVFGSLRDVLRRTRDELRSLASRLEMESDRSRAIIDTAFAAVLAVDGGGRIIAANPVAARLLASPADVLCGRLLADIFTIESLRMEMDELGTLTFAGNPSERRFETRVRMHGIRTFPADVAITSLAVEGQRAWAIFINDLTAKHGSEVLLRDARQAARTARESKNALLARLSRELRAPLDSMIGFAEMVRNSTASNLSDRDTVCLERVKADGEHLLLLVSDILDVSRIESGTLELHAETIDVSALVRDMLPDYQAMLADRPVALHVALPDEQAPAHVDAERLRQLLRNLLSNAVRFTARGSILITVRRDSQTGLASAISVRDTGIGIPLDRQSQIFDAFDAPDQEASPRYGGTGLGLSLARQLALQMRCVLSVESMPGAGSTFTLAFTSACAQSVTHELAGSAPP
jgi:PAS domain S-box-containing protein